MRNKKYTDEMYDFLMSFKDLDNLHAVIDNPYGLDETTSQIIRDILGNTLFEMFSEQYQGQTWTQMREASLGTINKQIEYYNGLLW